MSTTIVVCPECQAKLKVTVPVAAGKKIRCPKCQTPIAMPSEEEESPRQQALTARSPIPPARTTRTVNENEDEVLPSRRGARRHPERDEDEEPRSGRRPVREWEEDDFEEDRTARKLSRDRDREDEDGALGDR